MWQDNITLSQETYKVKEKETKRDMPDRGRNDQLENWSL